ERCCYNPPTARSEGIFFVRLYLLDCEPVSVDIGTHSGTSDFVIPHQTHTRRLSCRDLTAS
ncbi:MAG TPA: hypothetical protein VJ935_12615, partial [Acidimicrobiia bacterium]|nr:hypothetical protein [Acidimicrobiia bacterium]